MPMPQQSLWALLQQQGQAVAPPMSLAQNAPTEEQMMSSQMDLTPEEADVLASQGAPATMATAPSPQVSPAAPAQGPQLPYDLMMRNLAEQYGGKSQQALAQEQQGLEQLQANIDQVRGLKSGPDLRGLAALIDNTTGSNYAQAAEQMKPLTQQEKAEKLIALQNALQERKAAATKNSLAALKEQIDAYKASKIDPLDTQLKMAKIGFYGQGRKDLQDTRLAETAHRGILANIEHDKAMQTKLQQIQGIDNAGAMIEHAPEVTPQLFHDYQQAVVSAVNRGNSGIAERASRYLAAAGIDALTIKQYLSGEPMDIGRDHPLLKATQGFAQTERANIAKQYDQLLDKASKGQGRWYDKNPQMKKDLLEKIKAMKDMVAEPTPSDVDLSKMSNEELQAYIDSHGG